MPAQTTFRRSVDWNSYNPLHRKNSAQKLQDLKMTLSSLSDKIARVMCELREPDHVIY